MIRNRDGERLDAARAVVPIAEDNGSELVKNNKCHLNGLSS